jgi:hypothetical protein
MGSPIIISYGGVLALAPIAGVAIVLALIDRSRPPVVPPLRLEAHA